MEQHATHDGLLTSVAHIVHGVFDVHRGPLFELAKSLLRFDASGGLLQLCLFFLLHPLSPASDGDNNYSPDLNPNDDEESDVILLAVALLIAGTCFNNLSIRIVSTGPGDDVFAEMTAIVFDTLFVALAVLHEITFVTNRHSRVWVEFLPVP